MDPREPRRAPAVRDGRGRRSGGRSAARPAARRVPPGRGRSARPAPRPAATPAPPAPARGRRRPGARPYYLAALVLVLVAAAAGAVLLLGDDRTGHRTVKAPSGGHAAANGPSPETYSSSPSTKAFAAIARRATDKAPLTAAELFPEDARTITAGRARLALKQQRLDADCTRAVWGGEVGARLARAGCTQAARGLFADTRAGYALEVGVFNLDSADAAGGLVGSLQGDGGGFMLPLPAAAPLDRFGQGFSTARGLAMGHYAVLVWAARTDGKGTATDDTLLSLLIEGGKPPAVLGRAAAAAE
ncbi:hypothetical protein [Actinomadura parmotrematis]|uniref:Uncharacterized protein n=1 Tax=Actinomadura parmotrematis TaxID=2864039 RepID=A0ABS7FL38_9ACTN|nr:hypothetical protein [Actinomadura parmotrematis]MBW8481085.1 hypothetical protein [Actinomadura parmotrematis]